MVRIDHRDSGSVLTISQDDHPALATQLERELVIEKDAAIQALTAAKDWPDYEKRRGFINGLLAAISLCQSIQKKLGN